MLRPHLREDSQSAMAPYAMPVAPMLLGGEAETRYNALEHDGHPAYQQRPAAGSSMRSGFMLSLHVVYHPG